MSSIVQKLPGLWNRRGQKGPAKRKSKAPSAVVLMTILAALLLTMLLGAVIALGAVQLTVLLTGLLVFVPLVLFINTRMLLPVVFVLVFVVQGTVEYFLHMRLAVWMASGVCGLFFLRALLELATQDRIRTSGAMRVSGGGAILAAGCLYLAFYFFSLSLGHARPIQIVSTLRFTLPMWGVLFALYWFDWSEHRLVQLWNLMVIVMVLQFPVVLFQHFFNMGTVGWDNVVGTFGSGMSPILVMFTLATMMYLLARWARGLTPIYVVVLAGIVAFAVIILGEVKAVLFWFPVGIMWVVRRRMLRNVLAFVMFSCIAFAFCSVTYTAYKAMYWGAAHGKDDTMSEKIDSISAYVVDPNNINYRTGEISRGAGLMLWYTDTLPTTMERMIGFGPSAAMIGASTGKGVVAQRYHPLMIGSTTLAVLLWDVGIIGAIVYVSIFIITIVTGYRFVRKGEASPLVLVLVDTSTGVVALLMSTLIYDQKLLYEPPLQLLWLFCVGTIVQCCRFRRQPVATSPGINAVGSSGAISHRASVNA